MDTVLRHVTYSALLFLMLVLSGPPAASVAHAQAQPEERQQQLQQPDTPPHARLQPEPEQVEIAERECRDRLQTVESEAVMPETDAPILPPADLEAIRQAGFAFARAGHQEGCEKVAGELQTLLQDRRQAFERELELQRVREAVPLTQLPFAVTTSNLVGSKVVNHELQDLGTLEDLILTEREGRYALIRHGGFLGIGRNYTPVALERLRMTEDGELLVVHVSEELFTNAPEIDPDQLAEVETWSQTTDQWWAANVGPQPGAGQPAEPAPDQPVEPQPAPDQPAQPVEPQPAPPDQPVEPQTTPDEADQEAQPR